MIKARFVGNGRTLFLLGLSYRNLELLKEGLPIIFDAKDVGFPDLGEIIILSGKDEATIVEMVRRLIDSDSGSQTH